jgi:hypothetical protein
VKRLPAILISAAVLTACGTAASGSAGVRGSANAPGVQVNRAANAGSELEVNPVNPPITKEARPTPPAGVRSQTVTPNTVQPATPPDRCTEGAATGGGISSNGAAPGSGKHFPLPLCPPQ